MTLCVVLCCVVFKVFAITIKVIVLRDHGDITEVSGCVYMLRALVRQTT